MRVDDQREVIAFLSDGGAYTPPVATVERLDTGSAAVFLAGPHAFKLKRAVRFDYLDFSTLERRRAYCEAEVALNRRTAPDLYLGAVPVTRDAGGRLALGGAGTPVEWLVQMRRFDGECLLDRLAARGALDLALMPTLAAAIARLHRTADSREEKGGLAGMRWVVEGNAAGLADEGRGVLDPAVCSRVTAACRAALARFGPLLEARRLAGDVRACHGDLHLGNIVLIDGAPVLFDAVEFNDDISCIDVLYDLAFLLTDLWRLDLRAHASVLLNAYAAAMFDGPAAYGGLAALPFFMACRSVVRAKVGATASRLQPDRAHAEAWAAAARAHLDEADVLLRERTPCLVAVGGPSGTGKSTVARRLAPDLGRAPGAVVLRSDVVRKRLAGVADADRLPEVAYGPDETARVYRTLAEFARAALAAGQAVIVDATFLEAEDRRAIAAVAARAAVPFASVWLDAPAGVLAARVAARATAGDASDATVEVVAQQVARRPVDLDWPRVDAAAAADLVEADVRRALDGVLS